jgi:hypothetical protein
MNDATIAPGMAVAMTAAKLVVSDGQIARPEWGTLAQWQLDEIALALSPISFLSFMDLEFPPDERAHRFATELSTALSAAGSRVREKEVPPPAALESGIKLTLDAIPGPAQQAVAAALCNAGLRYRLHFQSARARPLLKIGLRPDCPLPRTRAETTPGYVLRAVMPASPRPAVEGEPRDAVPPPLHELLNLFRPLGDNCELGLVQRHAGAEPIDLLRFAGLYIPIEHRLRAITDAIAKQFVGLGRPGTIHFEVGDPDDNGKQEFVAQETVYQLRYHTARYVGEIDPERLLQQQTQVLQFWREKFLDDLRTADKVCVWKSNLPQHEPDIRKLLAVLTTYGRNNLLWVAQCDADHAAGTVDDLGRGLYKGYVARFAPYDRAYEISLDAWFAMCVRAYHVIPALRGADRPDADELVPTKPGPDASQADQGIANRKTADQQITDPHAAEQHPPKASDYEGWVDGLIDDRVCGWCWRKGSPDPVSLELSIDDQPVATFIAMDQRDDLKRIGIGNGRHGFYSPIAFRGVPPDAVIKLKVLGTDTEIPGSGRNLSEYRQL